MDTKIIGKTKANEDIICYSIKDPNGSMRVSVLNYGATTYEIFVKDKNGVEKDVTLGYGNVEEYFDTTTYYGMTIARNANRIGGAHFTLNGESYDLDKNDNGNNLHSGSDSLCRRIWKVGEHKDDSITFFYDSPDKDMGFGGNMHIDVTYTVRDNAMVIDYHAKSDKDTVFNPTNHAYFNLKGQAEGTILDHKLVIYADEMTYADEVSIPDGTIRKVEGTPFDFRNAKLIGQEIDNDYDMLNFARGYDHNFVLRGDKEEASKKFDAHGKSLIHVAKLIAPEDALVMDVYSDLPGVQLYAGNYMEEGSNGKNGKTYSRRGGVALETQYFPNAVNVPAFEQPIIKANEDVYTRTVYAFKA